MCLLLTHILMQKENKCIQLHYQTHGRRQVQGHTVALYLHYHNTRRNLHKWVVYVKVPYHKNMILVVFFYKLRCVKQSCEIIKSLTNVIPLASPKNEIPLAVLKQKSEIVIRVHPLGPTNVCRKSHVDQANICRDI